MYKIPDGVLLIKETKKKMVDPGDGKPSQDASDKLVEDMQAVKIEKTTRGNDKGCGIAKLPKELLDQIKSYLAESEDDNRTANVNLMSLGLTCRKMYLNLRSWYPEGFDNGHYEYLATIQEFLGDDYHPIWIPGTGYLFLHYSISESHELSLRVRHEQYNESQFLHGGILKTLECALPNPFGLGQSWDALAEAVVCSDLWIDVETSLGLIHDGPKMKRIKAEIMGTPLP